MESRRRPGRIAALSLVLFALNAVPASAGPLPELDATAGLRPAVASRALAARTRASSVSRSSFSFLTDASVK